MATLLDGLPSPKGHRPPFSAHICCDQMAGWIKTPVGREVGLGPSDIVLHTRPANADGKSTELRATFRDETIQYSAEKCSVER